MKVSLKSITPNSEVNIVEIARVSSKRKDKSESPEGLINYLIRNSHWSPFQHSYMTVEIITSKAIAIQYLRHLSFTFQEFSQRYATVENFEPIEIRLQAEENRQSSTETVGTIHLPNGYTKPGISYAGGNAKIIDWMDRVRRHLETSLALYKEALELTVARECARMILPMTTQTTFYMTGSVRSWIHLLNIRDDKHAQKEAQLIAKEIKTIFKQEFPIISKALNY